MTNANPDASKKSVVPSLDHVEGDAVHILEMIRILGDEISPLSWSEAPQQHSVERLSAVLWVTRDLMERHVLQLGVLSSDRTMREANHTARSVSQP